MDKNGKSLGANWDKDEDDFDDDGGEFVFDDGECEDEEEPEADVSKLTEMEKLDQVEERKVADFSQNIPATRSVYNRALQGDIIREMSEVKEVFDKAGVYISKWEALRISISAFRAAIRVIETKLEENYLEFGDEPKGAMENSSAMRHLNMLEKMIEDDLWDNLPHAKKIYDLALQGSILEIMDMAREQFDDEDKCLTDYTALGIGISTIRAAIRVIEVLLLES